MIREVLEELKELGFDTSKPSFSWALLVNRVITKPHRDAKVDAFQNWGGLKKTF